MERLPGVNYARIAWCCEQIGTTPEELALELGISNSAFERARTGEPSFTFRQLRKIASHFGRGTLFFLEAGQVQEQQVYTPQFRTLASQKPQLSPKLRLLIERAERQRNVFRSLREALGDVDRVKFEAPLVPADPREAAAVARRWLGLWAQRTFDEYRAAVEAKGILVFRSNGYNGAWQFPPASPILGFSLYDEETPLIVVRKEVASTRQTFTLMHELGHVLLHRTSSIDDAADLVSQDGQEREANAFAGHLLVPDQFLTAIRDAERPAEASRYDTWLADQRLAWGVSGEVILRRLLDVGRLTQVQYEAYRTWQSGVVYQQADDAVRMYRHREPKHIFGDTFVRTVLDALNAQQITITRASDYLDRLRVDDLHRLEQYYEGH